jgi:hypothetical protein
MRATLQNLANSFAQENIFRARLPRRDILSPDLEDDKGI